MRFSASVSEQSSPPTTPPTREALADAVPGERQRAVKPTDPDPDRRTPWAVLCRLF